MSKHDIVNSEDIKILVDNFYKKVLIDPVIGFIFTEVVPISWKDHMPVMYSFWSSMLLGADTYRSNPMAKHIQLNKLVPLQPEHFERWLSLWETNANECFEGPNTIQAIIRARNIASVMEYKVRESR